MYFRHLPIISGMASIYKQATLGGPSDFRNPGNRAVLAECGSILEF
jgi:hypothetical protein